MNVAVVPSRPEVVSGFRDAIPDWYSRGYSTGLFHWCHDSHANSHDGKWMMSLLAYFENMHIAVFAFQSVDVLAFDCLLLRIALLRVTYSSVVDWQSTCLCNQLHWSIDDRDAKDFVWMLLYLHHYRRRHSRNHRQCPLDALVVDEKVLEFHKLVVFPCYYSASHHRSLLLCQLDSDSEGGDPLRANVAALPSVVVRKHVGVC